MQRFTILDLFERIPDDHTCVAHLAPECWGADPVKDGMRCGLCDGHRTFLHLRSRKHYACTACKTQVRPTAGPLFHSSRTPLTVWF